VQWKKELHSLEHHHQFDWSIAMGYGNYCHGYFQANDGSNLAPHKGTNLLFPMAGFCTGSSM
jgi:hypothetical protein